MQLFASRDLLHSLRARDRPYGHLRCEVGKNGVLLIRGRVGNDLDYPIGTVDDLGIGHTKTLPYVLAEAPTTAPPWYLGRGEGLVSRKAADRPSTERQVVPATVEPYLADALDRGAEDGLVLVGAKRAVLVLRRAAGPPIGHLWQPVEVTEMPCSFSSAGTNPTLEGRTVAVVGCGSIGSRVAELLAAAGVERLLLFDPDSLEVRNLRRHLCGQDALGRQKVDAVAAELLRHGYPVVVEGFSGRVQVDDADRNRGLLSGCDALICCADSAAARQFVNHTAVHSGVPCIIADVQLRPAPMAEALLVIPDRGGCLNCWRQQLERDGRMAPPDQYDRADYPATAPATPSGLPMYQLTALGSTVCDLVAFALQGADRSYVQLTALEGPVTGFPELELFGPQLYELTAESTCAVCR